LKRLCDKYSASTRGCLAFEVSMRSGILQPKRPVLFVGNHTMFGIYDSPILVHEVSFFVPVIFP
jgi:hypothetical protein